MVCMGEPVEILNRLSRLLLDLSQLFRNTCTLKGKELIIIGAAVVILTGVVIANVTWTPHYYRYLQPVINCYLNRP